MAGGALFAVYGGLLFGVLVLCDKALQADTDDDGEDSGRSCPAGQDALRKGAFDSFDGGGDQADGTDAQVPGDDGFE